MYGWSGGKSSSACTIDVTIRRSYIEGFAPLQQNNNEIPNEGPLVTDNNNNTLDNFTRNEIGMLRLQSWDDYYKVRNIHQDSIAALLLTFPLTLYYAIVEYGTVPCTVATILQRPLRIHIVGSEKEINFLDLFKEIEYLLMDHDTNIPYGIELVFVVRQDMIPSSSSSVLENNNNNNNNTDRGGTRHYHPYTIVLSSKLKIILVSGTYGDTTSLDPNFDCGSGQPDIIMAFNAGLYAYESWRYVVTYLDTNTNCVGIFTDYNEYSGIQCASLGGPQCRQSLRINPFRQPRAMPVYSMNLPQFSNGFIYVFNEQTLE